MSTFSQVHTLAKMDEKDEVEWPVEVVNLLQWCLDEADSQAKRIQKRYRATLNNDEVAELAAAIHTVIGQAMLRKTKQ